MNAVPCATFGEAELARAVALVRAHTGIAMEPSKRQLLVGRLTRRLRACGLGDFQSYFDLVEAPASVELEHFVNAVTTNLTSFFREPEHFRTVAETLCPYWSANRPSRRLRLWSAGCSLGCEPYSLAMTLADGLGLSAWDWKILATDLDSQVLETARAGVYTEDVVDAMPEETARRWLRRGRGLHAGEVRICDPLRERVVFKQLNLMQGWPHKGPLDAIFCRNVAIYFDKPTQSVLFDRFADLLADDGLLFIGHSESLFKVSARFQLVGPTTYRKIG